MCPAITMVLTGIVVFLAAEVSAHAQRITNCDPPGSTLAAGESINNAGAVTGWYQRTGSSPDGFIRDARGTFTSFDVISDPFTVTRPLSINNSGAVTGHYNFHGVDHGFVRDAGGSITRFDPVPPAPPVSQSIVPSSINDTGTVAGSYVANGPSHPIVVSYIRDAGGTMTIFEVPGSQPGTTQALSINNAGQVTGIYDHYHGFIRGADGTFTTIDAPGSTNTWAISINDAGAVTGYYLDVGGALHGYIRGADGAFTSFDPPGSTNTGAQSINDAGAVTGYYSEVGGAVHGYIRGADGTFTTVDVPGSRETIPYSINHTGAVTGVYRNFDEPLSYSHCFIRETSDTTPPVITPTISGTMGPNGWYRSNVSVIWSAADPESGIASSNGCSGTTLTADTSGITLTCSATNGAGLPNSASVTIKIDKTPPVISGMPASGCTLWPPNHKLVQIAAVTAADAVAGLDRGSFKVTAASNEPSDSTEPQIAITANGSGGFIVQLQADRSPSGNGRIYTLAATAADWAGNASTVTATCEVPHEKGPKSK